MWKVRSHSSEMHECYEVLMFPFKLLSSSKIAFQGNLY